MGLFDRLFKKPIPENQNLEPATVLAELSFKPAGRLVVATCPGAVALEVWQRLRQQGKVEGFTALILGGKEDADSFAENSSFITATPEELIRAANAFDVESWVKDRLEEDDQVIEEVWGSWPTGTLEPGSISAHLDILSKKPRSEVHLAKVPTTTNWESPIYVGMGGWNDCPSPEIISAVSKRWHERFGAEIASITSDVMEFNVARPPATRDAALELAKEQYAFCSDIVHQGVGDISTLAAALHNSNYWYFWWD